MHYPALAASIVFNGTSLVLLKAYATRREAESEAEESSKPDAEKHGTPLLSRIRPVFHPLIIASMFCFAAAAVTWMIALAGVDLSVAYPSMSIIYVATALAGRYVFQERISPRRWTGIALVVVGIAVMYAG